MRPPVWSAGRTGTSSGLQPCRVTVDPLYHVALESGLFFAPPSPQRCFPPGKVPPALSSWIQVCCFGSSVTRFSFIRLGGRLARLVYSNIRHRLCTNGRSRNPLAWAAQRALADRGHLSAKLFVLALHEHRVITPAAGVAKGIQIAARVPVGSTYWTRLQSSASEFWIGLAHDASASGGSELVRTGALQRLDGSINWTRSASIWGALVAEATCHLGERPGSVP